MVSIPQRSKEVVSLENSQSQVDDLYKCCNAFYERQGEAAHTVSCPKASVLRLRMKQKAQGK